MLYDCVKVWGKFLRQLRHHRQLIRKDAIMKSKKHTVFLMIGLVVFVSSVIVATIYCCKAKSYIDSILAKDTDTQLRMGLELSLFWSMFFVFGILGTELSFIRSVYKMLKYKPIKWVRICYIISASLAVLIVAFCCLVALKVFNLVSADGRDYTADIYLFTVCPSFILSFVLGSVPIRRIEDIMDQITNNSGTALD